MKKIWIYLYAGLFILVALLYIDRFVNRGSRTDNNDVGKIYSDSSNIPQIVFVNSDSIFDGYDLYNELMIDLLEKKQLLETTLNSKMLALQKKSLELQQKYQNGLITTAKAEAEQQELLLEQQEIYTWQEEKSLELSEDEQLLYKRIYDSLINNINIYNLRCQHRFILNTTYAGTLLYGDNSLNITDTILNLLNHNYNLNLDTITN